MQPALSAMLPMLGNRVMGNDLVSAPLSPFLESIALSYANAVPFTKIITRLLLPHPFA